MDAGSGLSIVNPTSAFCWTCTAVWWLISLNFLRPKPKRNHFLILFILLSKSLSCLFAFVVVSYDAHRSFIYYFKILYNSFNTLFNAVLFASLYLSSSDLSLVKDDQDQISLKEISIALILFYLSFCVYSFDKERLALLAVITISVCLAVASKNFYVSIKNEQDNHLKTGIKREEYIEKQKRINNKLMCLSIFTISLCSAGITYHILLALGVWVELDIEKYVLQGFLEAAYFLCALVIYVLIRPSSKEYSAKQEEDKMMLKPLLKNN